MADFLSRDPQSPGFWDERFIKEFTPWDKGDVPLALQEFVQATATPLTVLIPGCGNGYEVAYLAQAGWNVTAIDFSPAAVASAKATIGEWGRYVIEADFFTYVPTQTTNLIYERAFFCALPASLRQSVVKRWAELLSPGALLAGYFFYDETAADNPKGPPFAITRQQFQLLMTPMFELLEERDVTDSIPVFAGRECWKIWRRRSDDTL
ncbi:methyltransferase [Undibacterium sp. SXout7W]|uniref:methyltransferase n=1 Tax=Undibacterium sp. SXout7W TaxID=3413049 RepID=UPI003BF3EF85